MIALKALVQSATLFLNQEPDLYLKDARAARHYRRLRSLLFVICRVAENVIDVIERRKTDETTPLEAAVAPATASKAESGGRSVKAP